jgi:hypothetical protein
VSLALVGISRKRMTVRYGLRRHNGVNHRLASTKEIRRNKKRQSN